MTKYRVKRLAQILPKSQSNISAGEYKESDFPKEVWEYQEKLKNLIKIKFKEEKIRITKPKTQETQETQENKEIKLNDDSN